MSCVRNDIRLGAGAQTPEGDWPEGVETMTTIVRIARGERTVVDSGSRPKMNRRLKQLRSSTARGASGRGGKKYPVRYEIED